MFFFLNQEVLPSLKIWTETNMASEKPQEARLEPFSDLIPIRQEIRLAQFSTSLGDIATARQQSSTALLEIIHESRDQYQSLSDVEHLILPTPPDRMSRWDLLQEKMDILQTLKSSLEQACNADNDLQPSTKRFLQNITASDVDALIAEDGRVLKAARAEDEEWLRSGHDICNKYYQLCKDIPELIAPSEGRPRAAGMLIILYWIALAVIAFPFKYAKQQMEAIELGLKHDFDVRMFDMFMAFSGAMLTVCITTTIQMNELRRRSRDFFHPAGWIECAFHSLVCWIIGSLAYLMLHDLERHSK